MSSIPAIDSFTDSHTTNSGAVLSSVLMAAYTEYASNHDISEEVTKRGFHAKFEDNYPVSGTPISVDDVPHIRFSGISLTQSGIELAHRRIFKLVRVVEEAPLPATEAKRGHGPPLFLGSESTSDFPKYVDCNHSEGGEMHPQTPALLRELTGDFVHEQARDSSQIY